MNKILFFQHWKQALREPQGGPLQDKKDTRLPRPGTVDQDFLNFKKHIFSHIP